MIQLKVHEAKRPLKKNFDTIIIIGDGWSAPEDLKKCSKFEPYDPYSIGRSIKLLDFCTHWGNVDSDPAVHWAENLPTKDKDGEIPLRHTLGPCKNFDIDWDIDGDIPWDVSEVMWHGSTALFAVLTALAMEYRKIILAGCPLDSKGHWYFPDMKGPRWTGETYQAWFEFAATEQAKKVRSMSGYTAQLLKKPDKKWFKRI